MLPTPLDPGTPIPAATAEGSILEAVLRAIEALPTELGFVALFAGTFLEYVFPPFPGDTVVVAGAALVAAFDWPLWPVFAAVTAGSVGGSTAAWAAGRAVARHEARLGREPRWPSADAIAHQGAGGIDGESEGAAGGRPEVGGPSGAPADPVAGSRRGLDRRARLAVERLVAGFERHGAWYLVLNRFMPGVRTFFFVAAGMVDLPLRSVLLWSGVSAALWNGGLIWLGLSLGNNVAELDRIVERYNRVIVPLVIVAALAVVWRAWRSGGRGPG